jgi:tricorn protease-like protein
MKKIILSLFTIVTMTHFSSAQGIFEGQNDVGAVLHAGKTVYDAASQTYTLEGAGANIWFKKDEFHYAWKKQTGDFILQARGVLQGKGVDAHRKFGWMVRTSLDTSAAMVCATVHGDGLTSIQYRKVAGGNVEEVRSPVNMPDVLQIERKGGRWFLSVAQFGDEFWTVEVPDISLPNEMYAGLFVCSHNKDVVEQVKFSNVRVVVPPKPDYVPYKDYIGSHIEILDLATGDRQILYSENASMQAPNWLPDNKGLIYNKSGLIYRLDFATLKPEVLNTDFVQKNNNDHVISFDGKMLGLSSSSGDAKFGSMIYTVPLTGGKPTQITPIGPSYLHGWSPDGKWLTFTGQRNGEFDIYVVPSKGGKEIQLTNAPGNDDGSEYSPDGKYIYFNSTRSGYMQLWRMTAKGKDQTRLTNDELNNWFPHISPDGKWIVFLSYLPDVKPVDHPFYKHVYLRMMPVDGSQPPKVIAYLFGGQGTINTPSWSPDGKKVAFVSNTGM